ncbi:MAG: hypothetical protein N3G76_01350 [Candidatus Micrarchaeota archaeon]|nr:hypothetical protein [Candidatus Micrarchaeota archaeon]
MKIIGYDNDTYAILVKKRQLENAGFVKDEDVYVITLEKGMLAVIRKYSFREHLKEKVRASLELPDMPTTPLSAEDVALLKKITSVKFEERIPENVLRMLSDDEMRTLKSLVDRGILHVYKGGKYEEKGVYAISKEAYRFVRRLIEGGHTSVDNAGRSSAAVGVENVPIRQSTGGRQAPGTQKQVEAAAEQPVADYKQVSDAIKALEKDGIVVIQNDELARSISMVLQEKIKKGSVMGMKGFDGKYYIMTSKKYQEADSLIRTYLAENKRATLSELSKSLGLSETVCRGVLNFLLESGDVIEKSRGRYELVL